MQEEPKERNSAEEKKYENDDKNQFKDKIMKKINKKYLPMNKNMKNEKFCWQNVRTNY